MKRRIIFPIRLLDQGDAVADLHTALAFFRFEISDKELKANRFGRTTRQALIDFQKKHHLQTTGKVDESTSKLLNKVLANQGFFPKKRSPFSNRRFLQFKLRETARMDEEARNFIRERLNTKLREAVLSQFPEPSERLKAAIDNMDLDYEAFKDESISTVIMDHVVPRLLEVPGLEEEVEKQIELGFTPSNERVSDALELEKDLRVHPIFREETLRAKNNALGSIVGLKTDQIEAIEDLDLEDVESDTWSRLVKEGVLNERERKELENTVEFAKLTDDNFEAIEALHAEGVTRPEDLISKDRAEWTVFFKQHRIIPPDGRDIEDYARLIDLNVQLSLRTPYTMERFSQQVDDEFLNKIDDIQVLFTRNDSIFVGTEVNGELDLSDIPDEEHPRIQESLKELNRFSNRYVPLGVREVLNDRTLSIEDKRRFVLKRQSVLKTFHDNNPDFNLAWANFFSVDTSIGRAFEPNWDGIDDDDKQPVRKSLAALQRTYALTVTYDEMDALLTAGLDSADAVRRLPEDELIQLTGLSTDVIRRIRARAVDTSVRLDHFISMVEEATTHRPFAPGAIYEAADVPDLGVINLLKDIDGYADLFGNQNFCGCKHCRSIFSPGAYFVDLMRFIETHISKKHFINPGKTDHALYLKNRRPDLWSLQLSCKNTDTLIPYLTIVNEVLAKYLEGVFDETDIFKGLTTARLSFRQPFNLPFEELKLYLRHFGIELQQIYELFDVSVDDHTRAVLGLSPEEFTTIVTSDPDGVVHRYGNPENLSRLDVQNLIKRINISREELGRLLALKFVRIDLLTEFEIESKGDDLIGFNETLHILIDSEFAIIHTVFEAIVRLLLDRLHRLVRLWRAVPWTPEELDLLIEGIKRSGLQIGPTTIEEEHQVIGSRLKSDFLSIVADLKNLQNSFSLTFPEIYALIIDIPRTGSTPGEASLFERLFDGKSTLTTRHPGLGNTETDEDPFVSPDFAILQGGLRVSEAELLNLITSKLNSEVISNGVVEHEEISILYSYARLARALNLLPSELILIEKLLNVELDQPDTVNRIAVIKSINDFSTALKNSPFTLGEIAELILADEATSLGVALDPESLLEEIRSGIQSSQDLFITPEDIQNIDGLDLSTARRLLTQLWDETEETEGTASWLHRPDVEKEIYILNSEIGVIPDLEVLKAAIEAAELVDADSDVSELASTVAERILEHHPIELLKSKLVERFSMTVSYFNALSPFQSVGFNSPETIDFIFQWINDQEIPPSETLIAQIRELAQLQFVFNSKLELPEESLAQIVKVPELFSISLPPNWKWEGLRRLTLYSNRLKKNPESLIELNQGLDSWTGNTFNEGSIDFMASVLKVKPFDLGPLLERIIMPDNTFDALSLLEEAVSLVNTLGLDGVALSQLVSRTYEGLKAAKNLVYGAIRIKYDADEWPKIIEPFEEDLNEIKRDALVDRILSREFQLKFSDTREIYQFFLLDVDMDGCARISRVKEAISACQLYTHRCLMSLEQSELGDVRVRVGHTVRDQWTWRKNYRVWEANRKVFLYPENYLEPDLRDNKSHIFKQAEAELMQRPLTPAGLEAIYKSYLREFSDLANIIIVSAYYDKSKKTYLVFGRTRRKPYQYYFRKFIRLSRWTMWEPIDLTIEATRVNAVKHQGQLYLFWLTSTQTEEADRIVDEDRVSQTEDAEAESEEDKSKGSPVMVNYSTLDENGEWSSPQSLIFYMFRNGPPDSSEFYRYSRLSDRLFPESGSFLTVKHLLGQQVTPHPLAVTPWMGSVIRGHLDQLDNSLYNSKGFSVQLADSKLVTTGNPKNKYKTSGIVIQAGPLFKDPVFSEIDGDRRQVSGRTPNPFTSEVEADYKLWDKSIFALRQIALFPKNAKHDIFIVNNRTKDCIFQFRDQFLLVHGTNNDGWSQDFSTLFEFVLAIASTKRKSFLLSTSVAKKLAKKLFNKGLDKFLSLDTQRIAEIPIWDIGLEFKWVGELAPPVIGGNIFAQRTQLDFTGPYGSYFREIFFHLPFLIAHYLNAKQKFDEADYWYRKIFDPTAQPPNGKNPSKNDKWRYMEFRNLDIPKLKDILVDEDAIDVYERDPFNPYAIARLRISAFQKATVMRYIDNLLDWGDHQFAQDTFESINEATMLFVMAADILGDRPVEVGECDLVDESSLTYQQIVQQDGARSDFLIELENVMYYFIAFPFPEQDDLSALNLNLLIPFAGTIGNPEAVIERSSGFSTLRRRGNTRLMNFRELETSFSPSIISTDEAPSAAEDFAIESDPVDPDDFLDDTFDDLAVEFTPPGPDPIPDFDDYHVAVSDPQITPDRELHLVFCVPPNDTLLGYWDRVEDRLFKIRNCMNIEGVRRQLPLFQPPIDPALLVRAKAAGISLEDILVQLSADMPSHRFGVLVEKARQFTSTVQQFGSQVQAALERKDNEELILLHATQQDELNEEIRRVKLDNKREATKNRESLEDSRQNAESRKNYYEELLNNAEDTELALNKEEVSQVEKLEEGQTKRSNAIEDEKHAANISLAPSWIADISGGFGFKFNPAPGPNLNLSAQVSYGSSNLAALFTKRGQKDRNEAATKDFEASQASLRAGHLRRKDEWEQQKKQAAAEYQQLDKQVAAAKIREQIADKDLDVHKKQTEHARELFDFYKDKFTDLGLYTYLSTSLSRLYRESYNMAHDMALRAQRAYQFETDDNTFFIANDNWQANKSGLLAGERLLLQLQKMEQAYLHQNRRDYEITLPCSLVQINPQPLMEFRETGSCDFSIPEYWFDLHYPGQYKRRIKSVGITIPCVTGPYTNVSAKLTLTQSHIRKEPHLGDEHLVGVQAQRNTSVAASTGVNDAGVFELNFRDERYLPFEGAGAISEWRLELPSVMRPFDYNSVSDVILHISFTAKYDGRFKGEVEENLTQLFTGIAEEVGLVKLLSVKHEFPNQFYKLLNPAEGEQQEATFKIGSHHFPYFLKGKDLQINEFKLYLKPKEGESINTTDLTITVNGISSSTWTDIFENLKESSFGITGSPIQDLSVNAGVDGLHKETLEDIFIMIKYTIS